MNGRLQRDTSIAQSLKPRRALLVYLFFSRHLNNAEKIGIVAGLMARRVFYLRHVSLLP